MEAQRPPSLVQIATKYGLIQGVLGFLQFLIVTLAGLRQNWVTTVISIIVFVVVMVLAHRAFKSSHEGVMRYGQGVGLGMLLSVVASVLACILVYVYIAFINPGYPAAALQAQQAVFEQQGVTGAELETAMAMTRAMLTPVGIVVYSLLSGVIVGLIIALVVSIFTRDDDPRAVV